MSPLFSVVVPVRNLRRCAELLLRCLEAQSLSRTAFECVVVDDASTDGVAEAIRERPTSVDLRLVRFPRNLGVSEARNAGIRESRGRIVVFLDGDVLPAPHWLSDLEAAFGSGRYDVVSGGRWHLLIGSRDADLEPRLADAAGVDESELLRAGVVEQFARLHARARRGQYPRVVAEATERELEAVCTADPRSFLGAYSFITANVAVTAEMLARTSGFDPLLRRAQDIELGIRLWEAGARFGFAAQAHGYHLHDERPDRSQSLNEYLGFFCRHPYRQVLGMLVWTVARSTGDDPFAGLGGLRALDAGGPEVDQRVADEFRRLFRRPLPGQFVHTPESAAAHLSERHGVTPQDVHGHLDAAHRAGLVTAGAGPRVLFDLPHTANWLRRATTLGGAEKRRWLSRWRAVVRRREVQCEGRYRLRVPASPHADAGAEVRVSLPLVVPHPCQPDAEIHSCVPADLLDYADWDRGAIVGYPLTVSPGRHTELSYGFRCRVHESPAAAAGPETEDVEAFRRLDFDPRYLDAARALIASFAHRGQTPPCAPSAVARGDAASGIAEESFTQRHVAEHLYHWLLSRTHPIKHPYGDSFVAQTGLGSRAERVRLFVTLSRLLGLAARERSGILLMPDGRGPLGASLHVWAELWLDGGWQPVDFLGADSGARTMTWNNVRDAQLRADIERETPALEAHYFGRVDAFRIYVGRDAHLLSTCESRGLVGQIEPQLEAHIYYKDASLAIKPNDFSEMRI